MTTTTNSDDVIHSTIREYADLKGMGISTVRKHIREGKLDAFKNDDDRWIIRTSHDDIQPVSSGDTSDTVILLLKEKDIQIRDLKNQVQFLQETLKLKVSSEERLQQIILSHSIPKLGVWQKVKMLFSQGEVRNV